MSACGGRFLYHRVHMLLTFYQRIQVLWDVTLFVICQWLLMFERNMCLYFIRVVQSKKKDFPWHSDGHN
jgi:hypothetical protein